MWVKKRINRLVFLLLIAMVGTAFIREKPKRYALEIPSGWPKPVYDFKANPLTKEGVQLGRQLFYDPILSTDSSISCGNCHLSFTAFTHIDHAISHGVEDRQGLRNSTALMNLAWGQSFMWDGAFTTLDEQAVSPISSHTEMSSSMPQVIERLQKTKRLATRFQKAFGDSKVTEERLLKALAQFQLTLISANSKYDQVMRKEKGVAFSEAEQNGYAVFQKQCASCHVEPLFTTGKFANIGMPLDSNLRDFGRMRVTKDPKDSLKFKIPTLRNIKSSGPYMHDGRFWNLNQVIDHYVNGIQQSPTLAPELQVGLNISPTEKADLIAFLYTLQDSEFLLNPAHFYQKPKK